ncbi:MAG: RrF2 family transcriptional regulator [Sedimentisphaeraceae bacterium JB056]
MEVIRRNTDYSFRLMATLAKYHDHCVSVRQLAKESCVPYQLSCKLLQKLSSAGLVASKMGPKGGYKLACEPESINLKQIVEAIQGPVIFNQCLTDGFECPLSQGCPVSGHLAKMQAEMNDHLAAKTLAMLAGKD